MMDAGKAILIILTSSLWVFTACALAFALVRRSDVKRGWRGKPDYQYVKTYWDDQVFLELLRVTKHSIICWLIWITPNQPPPLVEIRNIGIAAVGFLIGVTSIWTLWRRHRRSRHYPEGKSECP